MRKNKTILFIFIFLYSLRLHAFDLVSESEHLQYLGNKSDKQKTMLMRSMNVPEIKLLEPDIGMTISSPTNLILSFKAKSGSKVDVESLKILYGWLGFDITTRIKKHALITASGISAENVTLPEGSHVILVTISDTDGRVTEKEIEFTIE